MFILKLSNVNEGFDVDNLTFSILTISNQQPFNFTMENRSFKPFSLDKLLKSLKPHSSFECFDKLEQNPQNIIHFILKQLNIESKNKDKPIVINTLEKEGEFAVFIDKKYLNLISQTLNSL